MNNKHLNQLVVTMFFMLTYMALPANGNLVTAIQPDVFIEQALHLKAHPKGLTHWGLRWNLMDDDGKSSATSISISIHSSPHDAREIFDAYGGSSPVGTKVVESKDGPGEYYALQHLRVSFVRNNVLIIIELDRDDKTEPYHQWLSEKGGMIDKQRLFEKAGLVDKALQKEKGAPGVIRWTR